MNKSTLPKLNLDRTDKSDITVTDVAKSQLPSLSIKESPYSTSRGGEMFSRVSPLGNLKDYQRYIGHFIPTHHGISAVNEARAYNQPHLHQWGNALVQALLGTVVGGAIRGSGDILAVPKSAQIAASQADKWEQNLLQDIGRGIDEWTRDKFPIYASERALEGGARNMFAKGYFPMHFPNMLTTVSIMIPAYGVQAGIGRLLALGVKAIKPLKATTMVNKAGKVVRHSGYTLAFGPKTGNAARAIVAGISSRHMDSYAESIETYRMQLERFKDLGFSDEEASKHAAIAGAENYRWSHLNLLFDIWQWQMLFKYANRLSVSATAQHAAALGKTKYKGLDLVGPKALENLRNLTASANAAKRIFNKDLLFQGITEGIEELIIELAAGEGVRKSEIALGIMDPSTTVIEQLIETLKDPHTFDATFWGAMGGFAFGIFGKMGVNMGAHNQNRKAQEDINNLVTMFQSLSETIAARNEAIEGGDAIIAKDLAAQAEMAMIMDAVHSGRGIITVEMLNNMASHTNEQLASAGIPANIQSELTNIAKKIEQAIDYFDAQMSKDYGYGEYDVHIASELTRAHVGLQLLNEKKKQLTDLKEELVNKQKAIPSFITDTTGGQAYVTLVEQRNALNYRLKAVNNNINAFEEQIKNLEVLQKMNPHGEYILTQLQHNRNLLSQSEQVKTNINNVLNLVNSQIQELQDSIKKEDSNRVGDERLGKLQEYANESKITHTSLDSTIQEIENLIDQLKAIENDLTTKKGRDKLIDNRKAIEKLNTERQKSEFVKKSKSVSNIKALNALHKEYEKQFTKEYESRLKELKEHEKKQKADQEHNQTKEAIITKLFNKAINKSKEALTEAQEKFYNRNKDKIEKSVQEKVADYQAEIAKLEQEQIIQQQKATEESSEQTTDITQEEVTTDIVETELIKLLKSTDFYSLIQDILHPLGIIPYNQVKSKLSKQEYINKVNGYITLLQELYKNKNTPDNIKDQIQVVMLAMGVNADTTFKYLIGENYNSKILFDSKKEEVSTSPFTIEGVDQKTLNKFYDSIAGLFHVAITYDYKPVNTNSNPEVKSESKSPEQTLIDNLSNIADKFDNINSPQNKKFSTELDGTQDGLRRTAELVNSLFDLLDAHYYAINKNKVITLADIFDLYIKNNEIQKLYNAYSGIIKLFKYASEVEAKNTGIVRTKNNNMAIDVRTIPIHFDGTDKGLEKYINHRIKNTRDNETVAYTDTYIYMPELTSIRTDVKTTEEQTKLVKTFHSLKEGSEVTLSYDPDHNPHNLSSEELSKRNANSNNIPIAIKVNYNNKELTIGYLQGVTQEHNGVHYMDESGNFVPYTKTINVKNTPIIVDNIDILYQIYLGKIEYNGEGIPQAVTDLITSWVNHNQDINRKFEFESVKHVLQFLFYDVNSEKNIPKNSTEVIAKARNHIKRFTSDYHVSNSYREALKTGKPVKSKISKKSISPGFLFDVQQKVNDDGQVVEVKGKRYVSLKDRIAPITIDGTTKVVLGFPHKKSVGDTRLFDPETGKTLPALAINNKNGDPYNKLHVIIEHSPGKYQAFLLNYESLDSPLGKQIFNKLLDILQNPSKYNQNEAHKLLLTYLPVTKTKESRDFNMKFNTFSQSEYTFIIRDKETKQFTEYKYIDGVLYKITASRLNDQGIIEDKSQKKWVQVNESEFYNEFKKHTVGDNINLNNKTFNTEDTFTDLNGNTYSSFQQYLIESNSIKTNLPVTRDQDGNPISNYNMQATDDSSPAYIRVGLPEGQSEVVVNETTDGMAETIIDTPSVLPNNADQFIGKNINEVLTSEFFGQYAEVFLEIFDKLGLQIEFSPSVISITDTKDKNYKRQAAITMMDGKAVIDLYDRFFTRLDGTPVSQSDQKYIIIHELLHPIIKQQEVKLKELGLYDQYVKKVNDFADSLTTELQKQLDPKNKNRVLNDVEVQALKEYVEIIKKEGVDEAITYLFGNNIIKGALSKLSGNPTEVKGFWAQLLDIIKEIFQIENNKAKELISIFSEFMNIDNNTVQQTDQTTQPTKIELKVEPKDDTGNPFDNAEPYDPRSKSSLEFDINIPTNVWTAYSNEITNAYNISQSEFNKYWNELNHRQKLHILKCL